MMGRLFQVNEQVLLDVTHNSGRGQPPIVIPCICVDSESYQIPLGPEPDDIRVVVDPGGVRNLFNYYSGLRPPPPPPGTIVVQQRPDKTTFDNLEQFATDPASFEDDIQRALTSVAVERCDRADRLVFTVDGLHEGQIVVHRLFCTVEIDLYVAVELRNLMDPNDFENFIDSISQALRQTGRTYASREALVRRDGQPTRDFPIVRRAGLDRYIAYLKVGIGTFVVQSGWDVDDGRKLCDKKDRSPRITEPAFQPEYKTVPRRPGEPEQRQKPEFQEPDPEQQR